MRKNALSVVAAILIGAIAFNGASLAEPRANAAPLDIATIAQIDQLYRKLIDAENRHDLAEVRTMVWDSPSTLFVAKTATVAEGNWAGFWGIDVVLQHFADLYSGTFVMAPDYPRVKTVGLSGDVAVTYAPLDITVAYAGQSPVPRPFLMIVNWVRTDAGWKMATDVALPIPPPPGTISSQLMKARNDHASDQKAARSQAIVSRTSRRSGPIRTTERVLPLRIIA
jgi:hypothetical protein